MAVRMRPVRPIWRGHLLTDFFLDTSTIHKMFQLQFCEFLRFINTIDKAMDHIISACIHPIIFWCTLLICNMITAIVNHIPWTIYINISKTIPVIPFFYRLIMCILTIIMKQLFYFIICKAKVFIKINIRNGINFKIIQSCKNAFFCNPKASCQHSKLQTVIRL